MESLDMELAIPVKLHGRLSLYLFDADLAPRYELARLARDRGQILRRAVADNLLVTGGLNLLALGLNWAFIQNDNILLGSPFSVASANLGSLQGAVGTGTIAVAASNVSLATETIRVGVSAAAVSANNLVYDFFFGQTQANVAISQAGCFMQASGSPGTGTMLDRTLISPAVTKSSVNTAILELSLTLASG